MSKSQIAITKITKENVKEAVFQALELIKAKELFSKPNMKVLLKPNLFMPKEPETAGCTHPLVFQAVIDWLKQFNLEKIIVGESSGTKNRGVTDKAFDVCGLKAICEKEGIEYISFEKTARKIYKVENPLIIDEISSTTLLDEVDLIINMPKLKTHQQCLITCAIKNMFGTLILGNKATVHAQYPKKEDFNAALADIYSVSQPQLTIIDAYLCQEGDGPNDGDVVKMDLILAGYDPVALDTVACKIIGFDHKDVYHIDKAEKKGLGTSNLNSCELLGESIESVKRNFKRPKSMPVSFPLPRFLADYVGKVLFRSTIKFDKSNCKKCGTCWKSCPVDAIKPPGKGDSVPIWDKKACITCYCCAELCPYKAVEFEISIVKNVFTSWLGVIAILILLGGIGIIWLLLNVLFF